MPDIKITEQEEAKTEITIAATVYFHADKDDQAETRERIEQIRAVIEAALADEDNDLVTFVYPEVRLGRPQHGGNTIWE